MRMDPAHWPEPAQWLAFLAIATTAFLAQVAGPGRGLVATAWMVIAPAIAGGLIWRGGGAPWIDIAGWTLPMTGWIILALTLVPGPARYVLAFGGAFIWLMLFLLWLPPVAWWYRVVLRRKPPHHP